MPVKIQETVQTYIIFDVYVKWIGSFEKKNFKIARCFAVTKQRQKKKQNKTKQNKKQNKKTKQNKTKQLQQQNYYLFFFYN